MKKNIKANYGQDMAGVLVALSVISVLLIIAGVWLPMSLKASVILLSICGLLAIIVLTGIWSSRFGKLKMRDKIFGKLLFNGDESVLDIGCGPGLLLIAAAKQLQKGKAVGADHWKGNLEYSYTSQMVLRNAEIEKVVDRVEVINADAQALPFGNNSFDVVMTSLMMHHVVDKSKAINEMVRVLKPQGTLILADVGAHRFEAELKKAGISNLKIERSVRLFFMPVWIIRGEKALPLNN